MGEVSVSNNDGFQEVQFGNPGLFSSPADKTSVLLECFFEDRFRKYPFLSDTNMNKLWQSIERYLLTKFPQASNLATPFNDPIAESNDEYQAFFKTHGFPPLVQGAFGKKIS